LPRVLKKLLTGISQTANGLKELFLVIINNITIFSIQADRAVTD